MAARVHRPLKVIAFNANGILAQSYKLSKQPQDLHIVLLSETHLKPHERFFIPNYLYYQTDCFPRRKGIPHNLVDLPPLVSTEATRVCIPNGNSEVLLAAVCKSAGHDWNDVSCYWQEI
jgi:hypothetical protein